jgi:MFS transporter, DHA1 family, tetracycline resistance protein
MIQVLKNLINRKNLTLFSLCFIVFLDFLSYGLILPVLTPLFLNPEESFLPVNYSENLRTLLFGLVTASYAAAQFFGAPVIGALSDRFGRKKMLTFTLIGTVIANLAFILGTIFSSTTIMIIGRLIGGFMGGNAALANTMVGDISERHEKTRNYGFIGLALALGIVLGPYLGAQLADPSFIPNASIRTPFYFAVGLSIFAVISVRLFVRETLDHKIIRKADFFEGFHQIFRSMRYSNLRVIFTMTFLVVFSFNVFVYSLNIYLYKKIGFTEKDLGNFLAYAGICLTLSLGVINPIVARKFKTIDVLKVSLIGLAICFFWSLIPKTYVGLYILTPFLALAYGLSQANIISLLSNNTEHDEHGEAFGVNQSLTSLVEGITPIFTSLLLAINSLMPAMFSYTLPTLFSGVIALTCWLIFIFYFILKPHPEIKH